MRTEWFAGLLVTSISLVAVSGAQAQDPQHAVTGMSPFATFEPLSDDTLDVLSGGANIIVVEQGTLMVNDTSATATSANNTLTGVQSGLLSGNVVSNNAGFTSGVFNSGNGVGIAINTSVIINLQ